MRFEIDYYLKFVNTVLWGIGMYITDEDTNLTLLQRLRNHKRCAIHLLHMKVTAVSQITWFALAIMNNTSLLQITHLLPGSTLCALGCFKMYCFIYKIHNINNIVDRLKYIKRYRISINLTNDEEIMKDWLKVLINFTKVIALLLLIAGVAFIAGPIILMVTYYYKTGTVKLFLPFFMWYPFDEFQMPYWPFVFVQQSFSAWETVITVMGTDTCFLTCCTYIQIQFLFLQRELEEIFEGISEYSTNDVRSDLFKVKLVQIVEHHRELIRCAELLDGVYSKSTLCNVITSSLIICTTGFNLVALDDFVLMAPFAAFLIFALLQVYLYCYYGDLVTRGSTGLGDAIYNSAWYNAGLKERKYLLTMLMRSQKPCKFTAYLFLDINLNTFTRILSTSWSYFALLTQIYHD